jgi:hypothetical protein
MKRFAVVRFAVRIERASAYSIETVSVYLMMRFAVCAKKGGPIKNSSAAVELCRAVLL